jgi:dTDP-4-dehydrorhamnose reductase
MQTILVTGANGFVGSCLVKYLLGKNYRVIATGRLGNKLSLQHPHLQFKVLDFTSRERVENIIQDTKPDVVVHSGAMSSPDMCEQNKEDAYLANVASTSYLANAAVNYRSHFIYVSTDFVFDGEKGKYKEEDERKPVNYYGETKCLAEDIVMAYEYRWAIARTVMVYGKAIPGKHNFVTQIAEHLKTGQSATIFVDQVRTFTYVEDLVKGIEVIISKKAQGIYHLAGPDSYTLYDAAVLTAGYLQLDQSFIIPIKENDIPLPAVRPKKGGLCITKAKSELGYQPLNFTEGIKATFDTSGPL